MLDFLDTKCYSHILLKTRYLNKRFSPASPTSGAVFSTFEKFTIKALNCLVIVS